MPGSPENNNLRRSMPLSIAVLAGGKSRRMGKDKALLDFDGRPLISRVIAALGPLSNDLFIAGGSASSFTHLGLPHVADQYPLTASIVGVYSALAAARHNCCLVVSCDMPFAPAALAVSMARMAPGYDAVVPVAGERQEPLFAIYSKGCLEVLRDQIERGHMAIKDALARLHTLQFDPKDQVDPEVAFMNVNTQADLEKAEKVLASGERAPLAPTVWSGPAIGTAIRSGTPPLICFVGKKNSGKTTFLEKLVSVLISKGFKAAYLKHDVHGFDMDREGTDTFKLARAGASPVAISSPGALATIARHEPDELSLEELYAILGGGADIVIAEGFKRSAADKIEISRSKRSTELACAEEDLIAVISDRADAARFVPVFGLEDYEAVADYLIERYGMKVADRQRETENV